MPITAVKNAAKREGRSVKTAEKQFKDVVKSVKSKGGSNPYAQAMGAVEKAKKKKKVKVESEAGTDKNATAASTSMVSIRSPSQTPQMLKRRSSSGAA